jgi:hypothetical protein
MRFKGLAIGAVTAAIGLCGFAVHYSTGIVGMTKKPNHIFFDPGCICHDQTTGVNVWVAGPESLAAGQVGLYKISVARDSNIAAGFNLAAFFGDLGIVDTAGTQVRRPNESPTDSLELTHTTTRHSGGHDTISWSFSYRAPLTPGIVDTLYSVGNSVDTSGDPAGDGWNFGSNFYVHITGSSGVDSEIRAVSYSLLQNYPNPFNPSTEIGFRIQVAGFTSLKAYDVLGREVATLVNEEKPPGSYSVVWDATGLAAGVYFCRLEVRTGHTQLFTSTRKMAHVR